MDYLESFIPKSLSNPVGPAMFFGGFNIGKSGFFAGPSTHGFNASLTGEIGLLAAVIWTAIHDLESKNFILVRDARRFFLTVAPLVPFSFDWIMEYLYDTSCTPDDIRYKLRCLGLL